MNGARAFVSVHNSSCLCLSFSLCVLCALCGYTSASSLRLPFHPSSFRLHPLPPPPSFPFSRPKQAKLPPRVFLWHGKEKELRRGPARKSPTLEAIMIIDIL